MNARAFSLDAVLGLRAGAKDRAEEALGAATRERDRAAQACAEAEAQLARLAGQIGGSRFTALSRQQGWNALCRQQEVCRERSVRLREAEDLVNARRAQLVVASIDHELVVRLRDKWRAALAREQCRIEERQLEEFVSAHRTLIPPMS